MPHVRPATKTALICPKCKVALPSKKAIRGQIEDMAMIHKNTVFYEGKGCEECRFTGYQGRTAIYEILNVTDAIRDLIIKHASSQQIKQKAISQGMRTMRQNGMQKVEVGVTTLTEVMRVTQQEELP